MAKKSAKRKAGKRRKIGALSLNPGSPLVKIGSVAVGYLLGDHINGAIDKMLPASVLTPTDPKSVVKYVPAAAQLGLGGLLVMSKKPTLIKTAAGGIMAGAGLKRILKDTGVITGYQSVPVIGAARRKMAGYQSVPVIGNVPAQLQGIPAQLQGYRVNGAGGGYTPNGSGVMGSVDGNGSGLLTHGSSGYMQ